jgi:hypothetical protein
MSQEPFECPIQGRTRLQHCGFKLCHEEGAQRAKCRFLKEKEQQELCRGDMCHEFCKIYEVTK